MDPPGVGSAGQDGRLQVGAEEPAHHPGNRRRERGPPDCAAHCASSMDGESNSDARSVGKLPDREVAQLIGRRPADVTAKRRHIWRLLLCPKAASLDARAGQVAGHGARPCDCREDKPEHQTPYAGAVGNWELLRPNVNPENRPIHLLCSNSLLSSTQC